MDEPIWLDRLIVDAMHYDQVRTHGGLPGVRDENALESALARPRNRLAYDADADLFTLAAAYGFALATSHVYSDGNKRIAFVTMATFLGVNGWFVRAPEPAVVLLMTDLAAGAVTEEALASWLREHCTRETP